MNSMRGKDIPPIQHRGQTIEVWFYKTSDYVCFASYDGEVSQVLQRFEVYYDDQEVTQ